MCVIGLDRGWAPTIISPPQHSKSSSRRSHPSWLPNKYSPFAQDWKLSATPTEMSATQPGPGRCLSRNAVYLTFAKRNFSSRCPNCPMSPNIFAHLEFLSIAGNYLSNFLLIGFVTGDRWVNGFSGISWCKEFTGIFSPTTSVGRFRLTFGFNLFRSTIKRFKVSQAVLLGSTHAFQDALPDIFFRLPFHFFLSTFSTYLQDGTLVLHMLNLKHKNLDNDVQMWPKITTL